MRLLRKERRRKMRKIFSLFLLVVLSLSITSCAGKNVLLFLNWGEYVDEAMLEEFEKEYNCEVVMDLGDSNEIFYSKVRGGTTCYDVVVPSDYMVKKMYDNDMLLEIDFTQIPNYNKENLLSGVEGIAETLESGSNGISNYYIPYLWGTWGIMYSTLLEGLEESVTKSTNEWSCLFDRNSLPNNTRVAMYDSQQHAYYAACRYLGYDVYAELDQTKLDSIYSLIKTMDYNVWGTDDIKKDIVAGNVDLGYMWTGDFLYYYCENAAKVTMEAYLAGDITINEANEMINVITSDERIYKNYQIGFDIYIPNDTVAFCDNFVIPKDSAHVELAHKFINFMIGREEGTNKVDVGFANTYYVSYNTPYLDIYSDIVDLKSLSITEEFETEFNEERKAGGDAYDSTLFWNFYDIAIGIAFEKYYPKQLEIVQPDGSIRHYKGDILPTFDRKYVNTINATFNNARA